MQRILFGLLALAVCPLHAFAQREGDGEEFAALAKEYTIETASGAALELHPESIMNWANPARNEELGSIYVWERDGRPEVVGTFFTYQSGDLIRTKHAFHSLSDEALQGDFEGQAVWRPRAPGVTWKALEGTPRGNAQQKLLQMRRLAREFSVTMTYRGALTELRLLPQPLHRYSTSGRDEGAIFALVTATDPEALLLVESHGNAWRYAFARFHFAKLEAKLDGERVWVVEEELDQMRNRIHDPRFQERVYSTMLVSERPAE